MSLDEKFIPIRTAIYEIVGNFFEKPTHCATAHCGVIRGQVSSVILTTLNSCYVRVINSVRRDSRAARMRGNHFLAWRRRTLHTWTQDFPW